MEFDTFALAVLVVIPMVVSVIVLLLTKNRLGNVPSLLLSIAALGLTAWLVLNLGLAI